MWETTSQDSVMCEPELDFRVHHARAHFSLSANEAAMPCLSQGQADRFADSSLAPLLQKRVEEGHGKQVVDARRLTQQQSEGAACTLSSEALLTQGQPEEQPSTAQIGDDHVEEGRNAMSSK